jgi:predicted HicB family RNase H-like nuclease
MSTGTLMTIDIDDDEKIIENRINVLNDVIDKYKNEVTLLTNKLMRMRMKNILTCDSERPRQWDDDHNCS